MFGYITVNMDEMKIKDYRKYRAFYCGICHDLKENHGQVSRLTLTYDMTFLAVLLNGLYENDKAEKECRCVLHPAKKHLEYRNEITAYAADMNVLLSYYNMMDDWEDEKKRLSLAGANVLKKDVRKLQEKYPRQSKAIEEYLVKLKQCEKENSRDLDRASSDTGILFGEIFVWKQDHWEETLRRIGFGIGKYIYLMDAYEDVEKDLKSGNYNPWKEISSEEDFHEFAVRVLTMIVADASREFEKLPIIEYVDILRNILYSGIWMRYHKFVKEKDIFPEKRIEQEDAH